MNQQACKEAKVGPIIYATNILIVNFKQSSTNDTTQLRVDTSIAYDIDFGEKHLLGIDSKS